MASLYDHYQHMFCQGVIVSSLYNHYQHMFHWGGGGGGGGNSG